MFEAATSVSRPTPTGIDGRVEVLLVDNADAARVGLRVLLAAEEWVRRTLCAGDREEAVLLAARRRPRVALVELFHGDERGTDTCAAVRRASPGTAVLLTSSSGAVTHHAALSAGASGFIRRDSLATELIAAVRCVVRHADRVVWRPAADRGPLTERQWQVLNLMARGLTNDAIGRRLGVTADTIKRHTSAIYRTLAVRNRAEAVDRARGIGLIAAGELRTLGTAA